MRLNEILTEPEWSLASAVMFGQTIIKMYHGLSKVDQKGIKHYNVSAMFSLIILFGLVPSLIILSLIYTAECSLPNWVVFVQITLFILAIIVFSTINKLYVELEEEEYERLSNQKKDE